jgi:hypothetical protein
LPPMLSSSDRTKTPSTSAKCWPSFVGPWPIRTIAARSWLNRAGARGRGGPQDRGRVGVQTFAGLGEIDFSRYRQPTGALGRRTEQQRLSCDRQNRCQYAKDLKWPVRPPQASPHNTPRAADPRLTHTQSGAADPQRPTPPLPRLITGPAIIATRVPRRLWARIGKHWGVYMIGIRSFHGGHDANRRFSRMAAIAF